MTNARLSKIGLAAIGTISIFFCAFCLGAQWAAVQGTNGQLMMNLSISQLLRDGDAQSALREAENFTAANVSVLKDYDTPFGFFRVAFESPRILFSRHTFLSDYRPGAAEYIRDYPSASYWPEVVSYLVSNYPQDVSKEQ